MNIRGNAFDGREKLIGLKIEETSSQIRRFSRHGVARIASE